MHVACRNLQSVKMSNGWFSDYMVLLTESEKLLQENLNIWNEIQKEKGMMLDRNKIKTIVLDDKK